MKLCLRGMAFIFLTHHISAQESKFADACTVELAGTVPYSNYRAPAGDFSGQRCCLSRECNWLYHPSAGLMLASLTVYGTTSSCVAAASPRTYFSHVSYRLWKPVNPLGSSFP